MLFMFIAGVIFFFLGLYFENVLQGTFGVKKSPCFCCLPSFWCGASRKKGYVKAHDDSNDLLSNKGGHPSTKFEELSDKLKKQAQEG